MHEAMTGVWHWQAPHPDWTPDEDWPQLVSSYAIDDGERLLIIDPLAPPAELDVRAAERAPVVVLTCPWHRRDGEALAARLGAPLYVPPPDPPDLDPVEGEVYRAGDRLPIGVQAFPGLEPNDLILWIEARRALVAGDTLIDRGDGLIFPFEWAERVGASIADVRAGLRELLELPVELVLPTHGAPAGRAALERALA